MQDLTPAQAAFIASTLTLAAVFLFGVLLRVWLPRRATLDQKLREALRRGAEDSPVGYTIRELSLATGIPRWVVDQFVLHLHKTGELAPVNPERDYEFRRWTLELSPPDHIEETP